MFEWQRNISRISKLYSNYFVWIELEYELKLGEFNNALIWILVNPVNCPIDNEFTMFTGIYVHAVLVIELINSDDICEKSLKLIPSLFYHNK